MTAPQTRRELLPNGLTVLLREAHLAPVAEIQVWARVGSADERPFESGLAHFHEHMLFKGTERRGVGEIAGEVEGAGGRINAYTSFDVTVYHTTLPSDRLSIGIDVLSDAVLRSAFEPTEIEREIEVVLEEIRRSEDSPLHVLSNAVFAEAYRVHPYRTPILGTAESVAAIDRERLRAFFERWYAPDNLVVVAAGDFEPEPLLEQLRAAFAAPTPESVKRERPAEPAQTALRTVALPRPFERASLEFAYPGVGLAHPDAPHLDLLAFILGNGESSRLVRAVRERDGLADRIDAACYTPMDPGCFCVSIDSDCERANGAIEAAVREVERVRAEPVREDELEKARANFLAAEHFERESVTGLAQKLGSFAVLAGDPLAEARYLDAVRAAAPADLHRVARTYLAPERLTVGAVFPESGTPPLEGPGMAAAVERGVERVARAYAVPKSLPGAAGSAGAAAEDTAPEAGGASAGAAADSEAAATATSAVARPRTARPAGAAPYPPVHSYQLPNGAVLHVVARREIPVVAARAGFAGGLLAEDASTSGLSSFLSSMWLRGTRGRSAADFARATEGLAAEIDGFSGRSSLGLTLETPSEKLEPALDLFAEALLEPAFAAEELERERRETLAAIERREDRLAQRAFLLFAETHFRTHPYRQPMLGTAQSVPGFDREKVVAHHRRLIRGRNLALAVAGDVEPDRVARAISARLSELDGGEFKPPSPAPEEAPREIRTAELRKDRAQVHLVIGFRGLTVGDEDRFVLEVLSQLLTGQGGRLFLELRDRRGLAYTVHAANVEGLAPGFFSVYIATAPEKLDEARSGLLEELERVVDAPPGAAELERARRYLTGSFAIDQQRNAVHAAHVALDSLYGLGPEASRAFPERIASVTRDDVLRVARRVIELGAYTLAVIRP